ncbi:PREDICTED: uncharacterized protein LOC105569327 isoform X2 [Vollenhovia emeryi]|uniref:uncharacterized protein LOC105569327 isoform X2 n=1 Tax=Vollenhovia emeryi TaxID=411798 RepID=UPI0005F533E2|nr:PREDICTED: uncharacterized protein LOC105569327 isoform X2 [Vollenhovia emeryi]
MGLVEREAEMQELNAPRPGRSRDLFGVQLECRPVRGPTQKTRIGSGTTVSHLKPKRPRKVRSLHSPPCRADQSDHTVTPFSASFLADGLYEVLLKSEVDRHYLLSRTCALRRDAF